MAKLLNKDPRLYEAERERFLRELRQFHINQRCASKTRTTGFFLRVFFKAKRQPAAQALPPGDGRPRGQAAAGRWGGQGEGERGKQP